MTCLRNVQNIGLVTVKRYTSKGDLRSESVLNVKTKKGLSEREGEREERMYEHKLI